MKKKIALLLCAAMLLVASCAMAATDVTFETGFDSFDVRFVSEDDVPVEAMASDGSLLLLFGDARDEDPNHLQFYVTVAISEETVFDGADLADATPEQIDGVFRYATGALNGEADGIYTYKTFDLDDGVRAISIVEEAARSQAWVLTIEDGVFVQAFASYPDLHEVTDEDIDKAIQLMDALQFVQKDAQADAEETAPAEAEAAETEATEAAETEAAEAAETEAAEAAEAAPAEAEAAEAEEAPAQE